MRTHSHTTGTHMNSTVNLHTLTHAHTQGVRLAPHRHSLRHLPLRPPAVRAALARAAKPPAAATQRQREPRPRGRPSRKTPLQRTWRQQRNCCRQQRTPDTQPIPQQRRRHPARRVCHSCGTLRGWGASQRVVWGCQPGCGTCACSQLGRRDDATFSTHDVGQGGLTAQLQLGHQPGHAELSRGGRGWRAARWHQPERVHQPSKCGGWQRGWWWSQVAAPVPRAQPAAAVGQRRLSGTHAPRSNSPRPPPPPPAHPLRRNLARAPPLDLPRHAPPAPPPTQTPTPRPPPPRRLPPPPLRVPSHSRAHCGSHRDLPHRRYL